MVVAPLHRLCLSITENNKDGHPPCQPAVGHPRVTAATPAQDWCKSGTRHANISMMRMNRSGLAEQLSRLCFVFGGESYAMRAFLQGWSPLIAALIVVISILYIEGKNTRIVQERLAILEKNVESIRNAIEGNQGIDVRLARLDLHVNEKLQNLIVQRDSYIERREDDVLTTQDAGFTLKNTVDTIFNMTQRIAFVEEMLLDMQTGVEDIRKQQNRRK